jgi:hypothetical protein
MPSGIDPAPPRSAIGAAALSAVIWVNRSKQQLDAGQKKPGAEVTNLREAAKLIGVT